MLLLRKAIFILPIDYRMARSRSLKAPTIVEEEKAEQFKESNDCMTKKLKMAPDLNEK